MEVLWSSGGRLLAEKLFAFQDRLVSSLQNVLKRPSFAPDYAFRGGFTKNSIKIPQTVYRSQTDMADEWVEDQVASYRLTEEILLNFLRNHCHFSGTDADFDVKVNSESFVCRNQPLINRS